MTSLAAMHYPASTRSNLQDQLRGQDRRWVRALWEPMTGIYTSKECISTGNITGNNDFKLVLVDSASDQNKLLLLKDLTIIGDSAVSETPAGIVVFVSDPGHSPCVGVAISGSLLVYRNMKPYYRFNLPQNDLDPVEMEYWDAAMTRKITPKELFDALTALKQKHSISQLSFHSQDFLTLSSDELRQKAISQLISNNGDHVNISNITITCITTMKKNSTERSETDVVIVGTELGSIYYIDIQAYNILHYCKIKGTPDKLFTMGQYDLESRLFICTRESDIIILKRSTRGEQNEHIISMRYPIISIASNMTNIVMASRNDTLIFCTMKGKKLSEIKLTEPVVDMESFWFEPRQYNGILVAFKNHIDIYLDHHVVDTLKVDYEINWIKYGRYGREEAVLIVGSNYSPKFGNEKIKNTTGGIGVYIFRRTSVLTVTEEVGAPASQMHRLNIPKKTKVYVDQTLRERNNVQKIHATFQRDLYLLRLHITKAFAELTSKNSGMVPTKESEKLDVNLEVNGFGPSFRINISIKVAGEMNTKQRWIAFSYDKEEYSMERELILMPRLVSEAEITFTNEIRCKHPEKGAQGEVKVYILSEGRRAPIWMTNFEMPISEQNFI
uniref:Bardet-Biedl syndrome 1 N-terminal domain-containing protein n=1 Tax=Panagrolaimus sp. PS1159 TaxID=55785 RepID=A0AC35FKS2_9BILA